MFIFMILILILLMIAFAERIYARHWNSNLHVSIAFNKEGVFEGEKGELVESIINKKAIPIWWLGIQYMLFKNIMFKENQALDKEYYKRDITSVLPYEQLRRTFSFSAVKRGYYRINELELSTGDLFIKNKYFKKIPAALEIYIYPALKPVGIFELELKKVVGEVVKKRHFIEDPFQFRGIRDYYPFDSMKLVNWNATARSGEIKVNQYNYSSSREVIIMINFDRYNHWDDNIFAEESIRATGYFCTEFIKSGIPTGIITNACDIEKDEEIRIEPINGINHCISLYKSLARLNEKRISKDFKDIIKEEASSRIEGAIYVMLSHYSGKDLRKEVEEARAKQIDLLWIILKKKEEELEFELSSQDYIMEVTI